MRATFLVDRVTASKLHFIFLKDLSLFSLHERVCELFPSSLNIQKARLCGRPLLPLALFPPPSSSTVLDRLSSPDVVLQHLQPNYVESLLSLECTLVRTAQNY